MKLKFHVDVLNGPPPHTLSPRDIQAIFAAIPEEWRDHLYIHTVRLSATLPEHSWFGRPVKYSGLRLTVCSRGRERRRALRDVLRELAVLGLRMPPRSFRRLSRQEMHRVDRVIAPLVERLAADTNEEAHDPRRPAADGV